MLMVQAMKEYRRPFIDSGAAFYSTKTHKRVRDFILNCAVWRIPATLPVPKEVWSDISMDFIEGFPKVNGKSVILTVVYRFSEFAHFIALGHPYTAASVAKAFFNSIVCLHGIPCSIVLDRDTVFTSKFWTELFRLAG